MAVPIPSIKSVKLGGDARSDAASGYNTFAFAGVPDGFFGTSKTTILTVGAVIAVALIAVAIVKVKKRG
jgi:hypothetical protein